MTGQDRLRSFIQSMTRLVEGAAAPGESELMARARPLLAELIATDDWLADDFAQPHERHYQQYLLHCDPLERFSLVSFVWGPGQHTPVHDHTVWGLIGMLRGAELSESFCLSGEGRPMEKTGETRLEPRQVEAVSPRIGDIHRVSNARTDEVSISIHLYGANIGAVNRHVYDPQTGRCTPFVSGYANARLPNLWDRSRQGLGYGVPRS